jgi:hypothetical protein
MRPRLTASSATSWIRSRDRVTLRSRASRNCSTLLSSEVAELEAVRREAVRRDELLLEALFLDEALREVLRAPLPLLLLAPPDRLGCGISSSSSRVACEGHYFTPGRGGKVRRSAGQLNSTDEPRSDTVQA